MIRYQVKIDGQVIGTRSSSSNRVYTHAIVARPSRDDDEKAARYAARYDEHNFRSYEKTLRGEYKFAGPDEIARAKDIVAMGLEGYKDRMRAERNVRIETKKLEGFYEKDVVLTYCGRLDLAQKEAGLAVKNGWNQVRIVEVEKL